MPIITSLSTRFFGHPRLTNPTLTPELVVETTGGCERRFSVKSFDDMQSDYSSIQGQWVWSRAATHAPHTPGSAARAIDTACFSAKQCTNRLYTNTLGRNRMSGQPDQVIEVHSEQSNTGKWILLFLALLYVAGSLYFL